MKTIIKIREKGQMTVPTEMRRKMGLESGSSVIVVFDELHKKLSIEKAMPIDDVVKMNQTILQRQGTSALDYKPGDGFRSYASKKYGAK